MEKVKKTLPYCSEAKLEQRYLTDSKEFIILHLTGEHLPTVRLILVWLSFLVYKDFLGGNKYVNDMAHRTGGIFKYYLSNLCQGSAERDGCNGIHDDNLSCGAVCSAIMYFVMNKNGNLLQEYAKMNWAPFFLGVSVVGLEVGFIYAYKNGWAVSTASLVQSAFLAVALIIVGAVLYREAITANKVIGIVICLIGLYFINK